jgi:hypothetical protein
MRKLKVIQNPENEVPLEVLATSIKDIAEGIRKLRSGPLNEKGLLLLIQHSAPTKSRMGQRYGIGEIKDILDGIESLPETYLKKKKVS